MARPATTSRLRSKQNQTKSLRKRSSRVTRRSSTSRPTSRPCASWWTSTSLTPASERRGDALGGAEIDVTYAAGRGRRGCALRRRRHAIADADGEAGARIEIRGTNHRVTESTEGRKHRAISLCFLPSVLSVTLWFV